MVNLTCPKCKKEFSSFSARDANWCKRDRIFFCAQCATRRLICPKCGTRLTRTLNALIWCGILNAIIFSFLLVAMFITESPSVFQKWEWNEMEVVEIAKAPLNKTVKLEGTIESRDKIPINYSQVELENGEILRKRLYLDFTLVDASARVHVNVSNIMYILTYPHERYSGNLTLRWFENGDNVSGVGILKFNETGTLTFYPIVLTTGSKDYLSFEETVFYYILGTTVIICGIISAVGLPLLGHRSKLHIESFQTLHLQFPAPVPAQPQPDVVWHENKKFKRWRLSYYISLVLTFLLLFLLIFLWSLPMVRILLITLIVFPSTIAITWFFSRANIPTHVGFDSNGIYAKYVTRKQSSLLLTSLRWSEIREIEPHVFSILRFTTTDGREVYLTEITGELRRLVLEEYVRRKGAVSFENLTGGKRIEKETQSRALRDMEYNDFWLEVVKYSIVGCVVVVITQALLCILGIGPSLSILVGLSPLFFLLAGLLFISPIKVKVKEGFVFIKIRQKTQRYPFVAIKTLTVGTNWIRIENADGIAHTVQDLGPNTIKKIITAFENFQRKRGIPSPEVPVKGLIEWKKNRTYRVYYRLFILWLAMMHILAIALGLILTIQDELTFILLWITLFSALNFASIGIFFVYLPLKRTPKEIGFSSEGFFCRYRHNAPALPSSVSWAEIVKADIVSPPFGEQRSTRFFQRNYLDIVKNTGVEYNIGPLDDDLAGEFKLRLSHTKTL
ncbi:MAG: hypothetical protein QXJ27_01780 [Thermoplasmata archaeon]